MGKPVSPVDFVFGAENVLVQVALLDTGRGFEEAHRALRAREGVAGGAVA